MEPVIVAEGLSKNYGDTAALTELDLTVESGELFTLIGPNGAGKTTFVQLVTGILEPTHGSVSVFAHRPAAVDPTRFGVLPQSFQPPDRLTGRELLQYYGGLYPHPRPIIDVLEDIGMVDAADQRYDRLSGGQQRRICVGTALVHEPDILVLDEPTTGIDPAGRRQLWSLLRQLVAGGTTILLTTHDMQEAESISDRVGLLDAGRRLAVGTPDQLIDEYGGIGELVVIPTDAASAGDISGASLRDGELVFSDVRPEAIRDHLDTIEDAGIAYERLSWERPGLEQVYFTLTKPEETVA